MFEAIVVRGFTWSKRNDKLFKKGKKITDLTKEDVAYLQGAGVIDQVKSMEVEKAVLNDKVEKVEKAVKVTTKKTTKKK